MTVTLDWHDELDSRTQSLLGGLPRAAAGGTSLEAALRRVHADLREDRHGDPFLVVLSDGEPDGGDDLESPIQALQRDGVRVLGLGVGPHTTELSKHIPHCLTDLDPGRVPGAFARLLIRAVQGR